MGDKLGNVEAEVEKTKQYTYTLPANWKPENMKIVTCILSSTDGGTSHTVNNAALCGFGTSVDYIYK